MYEIDEPVFYGLEVEYLQETLDLAYNYLLEFSNEREAYDEICRFFKACKPKTISTGFMYEWSKGRRTYRSYFNKVDPTDKPNFAVLCRIVIWNHYAGEFELPVYKIKLKLTQSLDDLKSEIDQHLLDAEQHFRDVGNQMNTLTKFANETTTTVTLIHGKPVEDYNESELVELIRKARVAQKDISDLVDTSKRMKERHEKLSKDIEVYTSALDSLK